MSEGRDKTVINCSLIGILVDFLFYCLSSIQHLGGKWTRKIIHFQLGISVNWLLIITDEKENLGVYFYARKDGN